MPLSQPALKRLSRPSTVSTIALSLSLFCALSLGAACSESESETESSGTEGAGSTEGADGTGSTGSTEESNAENTDFGVGRPPETPAERATIERAQATAMALGLGLKRNLMGAMAEGGPAHALGACAEQAQSLTSRTGEERGLSVGRASLRLRTATNEGPQWVQAWLHAQEQSPEETPSPQMGIDGGQARFLTPILIEAPCLQCHGPVDSIAPEVRTLLGRLYPDDRATGYSLGDLRGALWAEASLEEPDNDDSPSEEGVEGAPSTESAAESGEYADSE